MNKKFSINEILDAVHGINPISNNRKVKELTTEKILKAVDSIQNNETAIEANSQPNEITIEINKQPEEKTVIKSTVSKTKLKKVIKVKKNNVINIIEKPKKTVSNLAVTGLYFFDNEVIKLSKSLKVSKRKFN